MKLRFIIVLITLTQGFSQVFTPSPASSQPSNTTSDRAGSAPQKNNSSPLGEEIPLLNPGDETITIGGVTIPLGDNRLVKARFEKYLNQPAEDREEAVKYHAVLDEIVDLLAPSPKSKVSRQSKIEDAFALLPIAASYSLDAKICESLAETIYASLQAKKDVTQMRALNGALEKKKLAIAKKADWEKRHATGLGLGETKRVGQSEGQKQDRNALSKAEKVSSQEYLGYLRKIAEIEVIRKKHTIQSEKQILQTKVQFQATMMQWLLQRRFHHVVIAARFYNVLWQDGDNALHMKNDATFSKLFSSSTGFSPTVTSLDSLANEAINDTKNAVDACIYLMDEGDYHTASKRLLEAFSIGEFLTPVAALERDRKRDMQLYIRDLSLLIDAIQAKDLGRARELTMGLKKKAKDFPSSKAESVISANIIASNLAISKAEKALINENEAVVAEAIQSATEYWPTNPKLAEFSSLVASGSQVSILRKDFKRLIQEQNYREIFKRQYEFAPVIANQPEQLDAFNQIITNLRTIEGALGKAEEFVKIGNSYAAWEQLYLLRERFPDDPKLGRELEKLAPKVADFTRALDDAAQLEQRTPPQTGSAISHYLKAKSIYPTSEFVAEGLERLLVETLGE